MHKRQLLLPSLLTTALMTLSPSVTLADEINGYEVDQGGGDTVIFHGNADRQLDKQRVEENKIPISNLDTHLEAGEYSVGQEIPDGKITFNHESGKGKIEIKDLSREPVAEQEISEDEKSYTVELAVGQYVIVTDDLAVEFEMADLTQENKEMAKNNQQAKTTIADPKTPTDEEKDVTTNKVTTNKATENNTDSVKDDTVPTEATEEANEDNTTGNNQTAENDAQDAQNARYKQTGLKSALPVVIGLVGLMGVGGFILYKKKQPKQNEE